MFLLKSTVLLSGLLFVSAIEYYKTDFDDKDPDVLWKDEKIMRQCIDCYLEKSPCTGALLTIKPLIHESFVTACERCSPKQRLLGKRFVEEFRSRYPDEYKAFWIKYDPDDKYKSKLLAALNVTAE